MATPQKPWKAEYAKSARSSCKTCKNTIQKEIFRLGKMVQAKQFDGLMPMWNHADCILKKANQIKVPDDVEGLDSLRWEDQQKIRKYVEGATVSNTITVAVNEYAIEVSQSSRATCRHCNQKILKGEVRISTKPEGSGTRGLQWHHGNCFMNSSPSSKVETFPGWDSLPLSDQQAILALHNSVSTAKNASKAKGQKDDEHLEETSKGGSKRKAKGTSGGQMSKVPKAEGNVSLSRSAAGKNVAGLGNESPHASDLEIKLEAQSKELWAVKDDISKHVTAAELRKMLEANGQDVAGSELDLRDRCADGMLFGALGRCPVCSGHLRYSGGEYRCQGYLSEWSKCSYSTTKPERLKEKWKIPEETSNQYLCKWFKSQKVKKPNRILPPPSSVKVLGHQGASASSQSSKSESLEGLKVTFAGVSKEDWKTKLEDIGGLIHDKIKKDTDCLVVRGELDNQDPEIKKARRMKLPVVRENYLVDCFKRQKRLPTDHYKVEALREAPTSMVTVKVKGRSAVHESSGLQDSGHILEDGKSIYNTTLNMSDLSTGVNSYYILQVIQEDKGTGCYVFRKWGRVGNDKIGGTKLEEMPKSDAVLEFKRLFLDKTGNTWEAWENKENFQKQPGRFFPLDIDYGVNKQLSKKKSSDTTKSKLAAPVIELMKMLFDIETYRNAMMEFEINMSEMPLGKLSKSNIQKGFAALTEIQNLLSSNNDPSVQETLLVDASNRFFTVIPSIHPHVIRDEDDFKLKVKMLEALQDIEIASKLVGFDVDDDESLDEKYKKLQCGIEPLPHDSEDYKLVEKYLHATHAPTHLDWSLELEDVFTLERAGEVDKYAPYRAKLKNKMLLWHGSRLTNFVGILSQGLRIAPPEAPATGYMFGKGIYFADLVSKSAQYCFTDKKNPVGLMLLSEVALGEIYELKNASYMDKPPQGKHSTKGLGMNIPQESEYVKWRDDVVVPCGKPVKSKVKNSGLMYNEYIVYNTAQVKMQYLLKVRFHHKR